jgi:curli biogenesis system outer membrane secretion channel CsgG
MHTSLLLLVLVLFSASTLGAQRPVLGILDGLLKKDTKTTDESAGVASTLPAYTGVKHALGVTNFENQAGWRSQWELGENLALMLESALFDTGRFVIVDRQELAGVLSEQDLQASGRAAQSGQVAQTGLVRSAKYIATGAVTRVDANTSGESGGISLRGIRVGAGSNKAEIEVVVRIVDTTSSQVVASKRISGKAGGNRLSLGFHRSGVGGQLSGFAETPVGEAAQDCITQAALFIAQEMEDYEVTANIVLAQGNDRIVINRGENYGIAVGQVFVVREAGEILTDPATGEILDVFEGEETARIEVTRVTEKVSYCKLVSGTVPNRGDSVVLAGS